MLLRRGWNKPLALQGFQGVSGTIRLFARKGSAAFAIFGVVTDIFRDAVSGGASWEMVRHALRRQSMRQCQHAQTS